MWFLTRVRFHTYLELPDWPALDDGASPDDILNDLYLRFKKFCSVHKVYCSISRFTLRTIHRKSKKTTPMYVCKAAKTNVLVAWLAELTESFAERCPVELKNEAVQVAGCTWGLAMYFHILKSAGPRLNDDEAHTLRLCSQTFLCLYSALARNTHPQNVNCWHHVPKFHQYDHLVLDAIEERVNPRTFHCFGGEDQVGKLIKMAGTAHPFTVATTTVKRYLLLLAESWTDMYLSD